MKTLRPTNNSSRNTVLINYKEKLSDNVDRSRKKKLLISIQRKSGRNNQGRITVRHRSGGKGLYRLNDFKRNLKDNSLGTVKSIEYDPFRTAFISYISYGDQKDGYIISPNNLKVGEKIISSSESIPIKIGNNLPLSLIPFGVDIHNIEMNPLQGGKLVRSAGTSAQIIGKDKTERYVIIKLPSKEVRMILSTCRATIGKVSNLEKNLEKLGKAGRSR
jgi:large subunit ribosomal protein L2